MLSLFKKGLAEIDYGRQLIMENVFSIESLDDLYKLFDEVYSTCVGCDVDTFCKKFTEITENYYPIEKTTVAHYFHDRNYPYDDITSPNCRLSRKKFPTHQEMFDFIDISKTMEENALAWYKHIDIDPRTGQKTIYHGSFRWLYYIKLNGYDLNFLLSQLRDIIFYNPNISLSEVQEVARTLNPQFSLIQEQNISDYKYECGAWEKYLKVGYNHHTTHTFPSNSEVWDKLQCTDKFIGSSYGQDKYRFQTLYFYKFKGKDHNECMNNHISHYLCTLLDNRIVELNSIREYLQTVKPDITDTSIYSYLRKRGYRKEKNIFILE